MSIKITPALLADLRAKANGAHGVIWKTDPHFGGVSAHPNEWCSYHVVSDEDMLPEHNAHIAAANPAVMLALVDEIDRLWAQIAAAPDLLAALEKAVADYGQPGGPWNVPSEPGTWIEMARDAIQKAKGES